MIAKNKGTQTAFLPRGKEETFIPITDIMLQIFSRNKNQEFLAKNFHNSFLEIEPFAKI